MSFKAAVSLLISCLEYLSIDVSSVLKSPSKTVLLLISKGVGILNCFILCFVPVSGTVPGIS